MRRNFAQFRVLGASIALCAALGCAVGPAPGVVYVERRPPPDRVEVVVGAPRPGYVWIAGYWRWQRNDYVWIPGRWSPVEHGYHTWVRGRWEHSHGRWYWVDGHWAH